MILVRIDPPAPKTVKPAPPLPRWTRATPTPRDELIWRAVIASSIGEPSAPADDAEPPVSLLVAI